MTGRDKFYANEEKERRVLLSRGICEQCRRHCGKIPELAHRIPKGYAEVYGKEVIHHRFNTVLVYSRKCNDAVLLNPASHPVEATELIKKIQEDLEK